MQVTPEEAQKLPLYPLVLHDEYKISDLRQALTAAGASPLIVTSSDRGVRLTGEQLYALVRVHGLPFAHKGMKHELIFLQL
jgi:hypothetical protein